MRTCFLHAKTHNNSFRTQLPSPQTPNFCRTLALPSVYISSTTSSWPSTFRGSSSKMVVIPFPTLKKKQLSTDQIRSEVPRKEKLPLSIHKRAFSNLIFAWVDYFLDRPKKRRSRTPPWAFFKALSFLDTV